jgi:hypothetical protein
VIGERQRSWQVHESVVAAALNVEGCKVVAAVASDCVRGQEAAHVIHKLDVECLGRENLQQARTIELLLPKLELQETDGRVKILGAERLHRVSLWKKSMCSRQCTHAHAHAFVCACVHMPCHSDAQATTTVMIALK